MDQYWKEISKIHLLTKHYLLLAEEIGEEIFIQPLKEHRDAYDHIIRIYGMELSNKKIENPKQYKISNMKKALGHEYRAFFDTADWLSLICRKKIRMLLEGKNSVDIEKKLPEYPQIKERLFKIPQEIAELRKEKDIGDSIGIIREVDSYSLVLDEVLEYYHIFYDLFA